MKAQKWDFWRREYDDAEIPGTCSTYRTDFDEAVTCPGCGRQVRFGDTFTSRQWHDRVGFGYGVCEACYSQERDLERTAMERREAGERDGGE